MSPTRLYSHRLPGVVDGVGYATRRARQASQVDDAAAAPLGRVLHTDNDAPSHHLPGVVDAVGDAKSGAWQASQVDDAAAAPLGGALATAAEDWLNPTACPASLML